MREINNQELLNAYMEKHHILALFDTKPLLFRLYQFEKGEILNSSLFRYSYLLFLVKGTLQIYAVHQDGGGYPLRQIDNFTVLGDLEFCSSVISPFLVEAKTNVICIGLSFENCKETLLEDACLLRFLLQSVSEKLHFFSLSEANFSTIEEKLLYYMKTECSDKEITNIEKTAFQLHCSRRQLLRVLKKLTEQNVIEKQGKGRYRINETGSSL